MARPTWPITEKIERSSMWEPNSGCQIWVASINSCGYGGVWFNGGMNQAHRVSYELAKGPIEGDLTIDHLCRNRACINPAHLEPVTMAENMRRGMGASARNARKTHCAQGHPYDEQNTMIYGGYRLCRACRRVWGPRAQARYNAKRKALTLGKA